MGISFNRPVACKFRLAMAGLTAVVFDTGAHRERPIRSARYSRNNDVVLGLPLGPAPDSAFHGFPQLLQEAQFLDGYAGTRLPALHIEARYDLADG